MRERPHRPAQALAGLSIKQTGLISRDIEVGIFLIDFFVAVDPILLRIVPHDVVPPIEQRLGLGLVDGITIGTARILLNQAGRDIVHFAISAKRIQHDKETSLMVIQLIDTSIEIGFGGKRIRAPSRRRKAPEQPCKNKKDESTRTHVFHTLPDECDLIMVSPAINKQAVRPGRARQPCRNTHDLPIMPPMVPTRASLHTLGCRLNQAETSILGEGLRRRGFELVEFGQPTDLLVLNTCAVTEDAERTSRYLIRKTLKHSPHAFIAVTGCYAQTGMDRLKQQTGIDLIVGHQFKLDLPAYLPPVHELRKRSVAEICHTKTIARGDFDLPHFAESDSTRALLKVQDGCSAMCSFCIIPFARGHERSRTFEDIQREVEVLAARGYREIVLTGVNIGQYAHQGRDFCALLRWLNQAADFERIRISSIEPTTIGEELLDLLASSKKFCPYLHIPLQSGDDQILQAMNRRHTIKSYIKLIEKAHVTIPNLGLGTDLLVGFPGETETAFQNTMAAATDLPFSYLHVFPYSPRPGTAAMRLKQRIPPASVKKRTDLLLGLDRAKRLAFHNKQIGKTVSVLFEAGTRDAYPSGTTPNFTRVGITVSGDFQNQILPVTITAATDRCTLGHVMPSQQANCAMVVR
jgi:threonylcarbamoyladenosine tRNA methylthiotransferase MtaB